MFACPSALRSIWTGGFFCFKLFMPFNFCAQLQSAGASWLFVKPPSPDYNPSARQDFAKNKYALERSEKGRFFFSKPEAPVLPAEGLFRNLLLKMPTGKRFGIEKKEMEIKNEEKNNQQKNGIHCRKAMDAI